MRLYLVVLSVLLVWHASASLKGDCTQKSVDRCPARTNGALIRIDVVGEFFTTWTTNDAFIDQAIKLLEENKTQVPVFEKVVNGTDCADEQWSWHVTGDSVWADFTIELCDGVPSYIEDNLAEWISTVGSWCPWSARVAEVDDRRVSEPTTSGGGSSNTSTTHGGTNAGTTSATGTSTSVASGRAVTSGSLTGTTSAGSASAPLHMLITAVTTALIVCMI